MAYYACFHTIQDWDECLQMITQGMMEQKAPCATDLHPGLNPYMFHGSTCATQIQETLELHENADSIHNTLSTPIAGTTTSQTPDRGRCNMAETPRLLSYQRRPLLPASSSSKSTETDQLFLQTPMPTISTGLTTFGYQLALRNRIHASKLSKRGQFDTKTYKPTFVHDCLMLPGSLASVLDKLSAAEIMPRMTPALLPGFRTYVHPTTLEPCLLQSTDPSDYVHGMVVFGQGRRGRDRIHEHYRPYSRRVKANVEIEVVVPATSINAAFSHDSWRLERRKISSHVWLWADVKCVGGRDRSASPTGVHVWTLEEYLTGDLTTDTYSQQDIGELHEREGSSDDDCAASADSDHYQFIRDDQTPVYSSCSSTGYDTSDRSAGKRSAGSIVVQDIIW